MPRVSVGKIIAGSIIALIVGMLFPVLLTFQAAFMMPLVLVTNLLMPVLFVSGGRVAAGMLVFTELASSIFFFGDTMALMLLAASVLPGLTVIMGMSRRRAFFDQLKTGIIVHVIGYFTAIAIAYFSIGGNMINRFIDGVRAQFDAMPDEFIQPIVDSFNQMVGSVAGGSVPPESTITVEMYRNLISGTLMDIMETLYVENLPGCFLIGALLTGVVSVLWGNWRMARKGLATTESFIGMSQWNLPAYITGGVFFIWIAGYIIYATKGASARSVYRASYLIVQVAFYIQAVSCIDRWLKARYMGLRGRRIVTIMLLIGAMIIPLINVILFVVGGGSAFTGMIRSNAKANDENNSNDDENDNLQ